MQPRNLSIAFLLLLSLASLSLAQTLPSTELTVTPQITGAPALKNAKQWWLTHSEVSEEQADLLAHQAVEGLRVDILGFLRKLKEKIVELSELRCVACRAVVKSLQAFLQTGHSTQFFEGFASKICSVFTNETLCQGVTNEYTAEVVYILSTRFVDPEGVCSFARLCPRTQSDREEEQLTVQAILNTPPLEGAQVAPARVYPAPSRFSAVSSASSGAAFGSAVSAALRKSSSSSPAPSASEGFFLHVTDVHVDPDYQPGTNFDCNLPLCCRAEDGVGEAGLWGHSHCDTPLPLFENFLNFASSKVIPEIDFILWTGDDQPHDVWAQSQEKQLASTRLVADRLKKFFPNKPVYPAIGNHGCFPADQFDLSRDAWLLNGLADIWGTWLPEDAIKTLRQFGYYTVKHSENLRIISLNGQYCDTINFWLVLNSTDAGNQLGWLVSTLLEAEKNGENVYIIGHIPPGDTTCISKWGKLYSAIVDRFRNTITGQYFGHTHNDQFDTFKSLDDSKTPTGTAFIAPSITTYFNINPSFRLFSYDRPSSLLSGIRQYSTDLDEANRYPEVGPQWRLVYSAVEEFGLADMSPASWADLAQRIWDNESDFIQYVRHFNGGTEDFKCTGMCQKRHQCEVMFSVFEETRACMGILGDTDFQTFWSALIDKLTSVKEKEARYLSEMFHGH
eukprot:GILI01004336.1.p1 GENE.GILI01004336.1~~GILI01004336.1.p1  ORF type:complete len:710 (-),score=221.65 GILI01004336.1:444-2471(-)